MADETQQKEDDMTEDERDEQRNKEIREGYVKRIRGVILQTLPSFENADFRYQRADEMARLAVDGFYAGKVIRTGMRAYSGEDFGEWDRYVEFIPGEKNTTEVRIGGDTALYVETDNLKRAVVGL